MPSPPGRMTNASARDRSSGRLRSNMSGVTISSVMVRWPTSRSSRRLGIRPITSPPAAIAAIGDGTHEADVATAVDDANACRPRAFRQAAPRPGDRPGRRHTASHKTRRRLRPFDRTLINRALTLRPRLPAFKASLPAHAVAVASAIGLIGSAHLRTPAQTDRPSGALHSGRFRLWCAAKVNQMFTAMISRRHLLVVFLVLALAVGLGWAGIE